MYGEVALALLLRYIFCKIVLASHDIGEHYNFIHIIQVSQQKSKPKASGPL